MHALEEKKQQTITSLKSDNQICLKPVVTLPTSERQRRRLGATFLNFPVIKRKKQRPTPQDLFISEIAGRQSIIFIRSTNNEKYNKINQSAENNRIRINVCGDRYETYRTTLDVFPYTLLGNEKQRSLYYDEARKEYFFDRHRTSFGAILYYYQSQGRLRRPDSVPLDIFLAEVLFFQLGTDAFQQIKRDEYIVAIKKFHLPTNPVQRFLWATTEYPHYSKLAKLVHIISLLMVILLALVLSLETLPQYDNAFCTKDLVRNISATLNQTHNNTSNGSESCSSYFKSPFFLIQSICIGFFTIEFLSRILTTPSLIDFVMDLMNWIDIIAIILFCITIAIYLTVNNDQINMNTSISLRFLRVIRLLQVLKFGRTFRNVKSLRVFLVTANQSILDFVVIIIIITAIGFFFGGAAYYLEYNSNGQEFDSIFVATYWSIITITTVGYGDITPNTITGRIISCLCALFGVTTVGMLTSVILGRYRHVYVRTIFIDEDALKFFKHSIQADDLKNFIDENILAETHTVSNIENSDIKTIQNVTNSTNPSHIISTRDLKSATENSKYVIVGDIINGHQKISEVLLEKIHDIIENKQTSDINISFSIIYDTKKSQTSSFNVPFQLESSSNEESAAGAAAAATAEVESNHDEESLTKIVKCYTNRRSVLKSFQRQTSEDDD